MTEQQNQVEQTQESTELDFDLSDFTNEDEETSTEVQNPAEESTEVASTEENPKAEEPLIEIVYNGEKKGVTKEEAITLAQKGMNYDKLVNQLNETRNSTEMTMLNELAKANGMSPTDYLGRLQQFQMETKVNTAYQQMKEKYPETNEELLRQTAIATVNQQMQAEMVRKSELEYQEQHEREERALRDLEAFQQFYPDADIRNLPPEVIQGVKSGETLLSAYRGYDLDKIRKENEILKLNNTNKNASVGSLTANQASLEESDPLLAGLMSK